MIILSKADLELTDNDVRNDFVRMVKYHIDHELNLFIFIDMNGSRICICRKPLDISINLGSNYTIYFEDDAIWIDFDRSVTFSRGETENEFHISSGEVTYTFSDGEE